MVGGVKAADYVESPDQCSSNMLYVDHGNGEFTCTDDMIQALNSIKEGENAEVVLLKDKELGSAAVDITKNVTINLNGKKLTTSTTSTTNFTVKGADVTIKNGRLDLLANHGHIVVDSTDKASTLTIESDVKVNATYYGSSAIQITNAAQKTVVNINGNWSVVNEIVACNPGKDEDLTINLNATVTTPALQNTKALINLDAGTTTVNVNGGSYTSNDRVFILKNGTLNINAGTIKATGAATAIWVQEPNTAKYTNALNVKGGVITSASSTEEAIWFDGSNGTYSFEGGTVTSGKDKDGKQLPALHIRNWKFLDNHAGMITKGTFTGSIVGNVQVGQDTYKTASEASKILVAEGIAMVNENGQVVVGTTNADQTEQAEEPTAPESQEATGNTADAKNPGTSDNFMSLVSLVSASAAGLFIAFKKAFPNGRWR